MKTRDALPALDVRNFAVSLDHGITEEGAVYFPAIGPADWTGKRPYLDVTGDTVYLFDHEIEEPPTGAPLCDICAVVLPNHADTCLDSRPISRASYLMQ